MGTRAVVFGGGEDNALALTVREDDGGYDGGGIGGKSFPDLGDDGSDATEFLDLRLNESRLKREV